MSTLICYDGSESAKHAVRVAAATLAHKPVTLLHVWNPPVAFLADAFGSKDLPSEPSITELDRLALERAQTIAQAGRELADGLGLAVEVRIERNETSVWQTILARGRPAAQSASTADMPPSPTSIICQARPAWNGSPA